MKSDRTKSILKIQTTALSSMLSYMHGKDVTQIMPVMLSPITDPLCHSVFDAEIEYYGQKLKLTKSMLMHKQVALMSTDKIFILSPNVRLEKEECGQSGRHAFEFSQIDMEFKGKDKHEFMDFAEDLVIKVLGAVKRECKDELEKLGRDFVVPTKPFKVYESKELIARYGEDYEKIMSEKSKEPFWIMDLEREFYDKEDDEKKGYYHNYDMVWPDGFGEALSGGERDFEYEVLLRKMKERKMDLAPYETYLELAKQGLIPMTSGGGLGIERLVRFCTGAKHVSEVQLFERIPGETVLL